MSHNSNYYLFVLWIRIIMVAGVRGFRGEDSNLHLYVSWVTKWTCIQKFGARGMRIRTCVRIFHESWFKLLFVCFTNRDIIMDGDVWGTRSDALNLRLYISTAIFLFHKQGYAYVRMLLTSRVRIWTCICTFYEYRYEYECGCSRR